ncbi:hypothetical protein FRB94_008612 [Tulasnella sp. JGI-2019a]|nr:hypothetical protein FRB93_001484 [Tulasnella sp. JGI-2019a]KAG8995972.1 hypothetical protein FRB94_008612 [Tulasnella sp. JGI-2019a]KAG9033292.1 hypothetical protein FRB95_000387 [Tulasnella sp. JGI-2019a]
MEWPKSLAKRNLRVVLSARAGGVEGGDWDLCQTEEQYAITATDGFLTLITRINPYSQVVPWGFKSTVFWSIKICATGQQIQLCQHSIELYAVSARLPPIFDHLGIPNGLLSLMVLPTRGKKLHSFPEYVAHITETVHWGTNCRYARDGAITAYGSAYTTRHIAGFKLQAWLAAIRAR